MKKLFAALVFAGVLALMPAARADVIVIFELLDATDGCAPGSLGCEGAGVGGYFTFDETTDQVIRWDVYTPDYNFSPTDSEVVAYIGSLGNDVINWSNGPTSSIYYEELGFGFPTPLGVVSDPAGGQSYSDEDNSQPLYYTEAVPISVQVPEPGSLVLLGSALLGLGAIWRRRSVR